MYINIVKKLFFFGIHLELCLKKNYLVPLKRYFRTTILTHIQRRRIVQPASTTIDDHLNNIQKYLHNRTLYNTLYNTSSIITAITVLQYYSTNKKKKI